jgi:hypothetical protein
MMRARTFLTLTIYLETHNAHSIRLIFWFMLARLKKLENIIKTKTSRVDMNIQIEALSPLNFDLYCSITDHYPLIFT